MITQEQKTALFSVAFKAREAAYAPYSGGYFVGAAVLTAGGEIFTGCNIENAAHTSTICAERLAIFRAVSERERDFVAMMVVTEDGGAPCGVCRQVMAELSPNITVIFTDCDRMNEKIATLDELLPHSWSNPRFDK